MEQQATGRFDVEMTPLSDDPSDDPSDDDRADQGAEASDHDDPDAGGGAALGRMALAKQFHGDLAARGRGQMLTAMGSVAGSAGYVAIERVSGTLHGKRGSFVLQHTGTMNRGAPSLSITVVPDSATGELAGLAGSLKINIVEGKHHYVFDYQLAPRD